MRSRVRQSGNSLFVLIPLLGAVEQFLTHHGAMAIGAFQCGAFDTPLVGYPFAALRAHAIAARSECAPFVPAASTTGRTLSPTAAHSSTVRHNVSFLYSFRCPCPRCEVGCHVIVCMVDPMWPTTEQCTRSSHFAQSVGPSAFGLASGICGRGPSMHSKHVHMHHDQCRRRCGTHINQRLHDEPVQDGLCCAAKCFLSDS